jgi:hypothetical protein
MSSKQVLPIVLLGSFFLVGCTDEQFDRIAIRAWTEASATFCEQSSESQCVEGKDSHESDAVRAASDYISKRFGIPEAASSRVASALNKFSEVRTERTIADREWLLQQALGQRDFRQFIASISRAKEGDTQSLNENLFNVAQYWHPTLPPASVQYGPMASVREIAKTLWND